MGSAIFEVRHNAMTINSFSSFLGVKGGFNHGCKDVYFIRAVGSCQSYGKDITDMDKKLTDRAKTGLGLYSRIQEFPRLCSQEDIMFYSDIFDRWEKGEQDELVIKSVQNQTSVRAVLSDAVKKTLGYFRHSTAHVSPTIEKNFVIKLLFWADQLAGSFLTGWNEKNSHKFVCSGMIKKQEYLFCYLLTLMGIDVLLLLPQGDIQAEDSLQTLSALWKLGENGQAVIPPYDAMAFSQEKTGIDATGEKDRPFCGTERTNTASKACIKVKVPERPHTSNTQVNVPVVSGRKGDEELPFEELAKLASSVVMITVHSENREIISTGSGIMIGAKGFILTNHHVASNGMFYSVRIEDDEKLYQTDEIIKYHPVLDLAVIRINRNLKPIPLYRGIKPLARGQKVVAIGSPLGLFNSVSDGIISGFRKIDDVDMIQFTAPISHGSSGGALLNMQGEVIGISTAGFDQGQNINLAVDYKCITSFTQGFV